MTGPFAGEVKIKRVKIYSNYANVEEIYGRRSKLNRSKGLGKRGENSACAFPGNNRWDNGPGRMGNAGCPSLSMLPAGVYCTCYAY